MLKYKIPQIVTLTPIIPYRQEACKRRGQEMKISRPRSFYLKV